jgi:hypothetical protein
MSMGIRKIALVGCLALGLGVLSLAPVTRAAEPASGTVEAANPQVTWSGGPLLFTTLGTGCDPVTPQCDVFDLTIGALAVEAPDVVISAAAGQATDVIGLYVYDATGAQIASDDSLTANPRVQLRDPVPGTYSVRVEAFLGPGGPVSYDALAAATDAGEAPDAEEPCTGDDEGLGPPPQNVLDAALADDGRIVDLDVLVLLDGVDEAYAASFFEKVSLPYREIDIEVIPTFEVVPDGAITSDVTTEIIEQAKGLVPDRRVPDEYDVVELLTHRNITALGLDAVAGQAECIGGAAYKQHSFNVSEAQADIDQGGVTFGPVILVPNVAAKITAHEIGHLFGGQHHYANCVEGFRAEEATTEDSSPCSLMFNSADFMALHFGTLNGKIIRGYALEYAAANDTTSAT